MPTYEVDVVVTTEKTYRVTIEAEDISLAEDEVYDSLLAMDVTGFPQVDDVTGWQWVNDEIQNVREVD